MLLAQPRGTCDIARIATDHINNPNAINPIFLLAERERIAVPEKMAGGTLALPGEKEEMAVPHVLNVSFPGCAADGLLMALDLAGVACSTGSACSSGSLLPSPVLQAMGVPEDVLRSAMRFSLSPQTTEAEIDEAAARIVAAVRRLRSLVPDE